MSKLRADALPDDALVYEFCLVTDEDQYDLLMAFNKLIHKGDRLGIIGAPGTGKSTFALTLLNTFGLSTENANYKNRGDWQSPDLGTIRIYDNFTEDYHRFNAQGDQVEADASVVIVEHANLDQADFDLLVMLEPGSYHNKNCEPCEKNVILIVPEERNSEPEFQTFLEKTEDLAVCFS